MVKRGLVWVQPSGDAITIPEAVMAKGWQAHRVTNPDEADTVCQDLQPCVGVIDLTRGPAVSREWRDVLLGLRLVQWIALVTDDTLQDPVVVDTVRDHCQDYHRLPLDGERLACSLGHAWGMSRLQAAPQPAAVFARMVGHSPCMKHVFRLIPRFARSQAPVLIQGESGTGKELVARAIHERSGQANGPFVAVNCGALPAGLIHSELFGHERGAFTGASARRIGRIEAADGGTLFLDEIGDLPIELQVNLLRFLQEGTIERLGSTRSLHPRVRVIAATYVDLDESLASQGFREDLYYRLNVLRVDMPPLRGRGDDIIALAEYYLRTFADEGRGRVVGFSRHAVEAMQAHTWPGNVRELMNRVRGAAVLCDQTHVTPRDLGLERRRQVHRCVDSLETARRDAERIAIRSALARYAHNYTLAARALGVSRATLYRMVRRHGLDLRGRGCADPGNDGSGRGAAGT